LTSSPIPTEGGKSWTWELHELSEGPSAIVYDEHGRMIADHLTPAIAAKIAAVPALLEALTKVSMSAVIIPGMPSEAALPSAVLKEVAAALAQATGGEDVLR